jgi:serine/threonine-protein kinase
MESNLVGTQLGKYEIQAEVGRGGMGVVYKGYDPALDRYVAVKVLVPHLVWEKEFVEHFVREARSAARLEHANVVTIHEVGQAAGWYYFVMEYLEGPTLTEMIQERRPLAPDEALSILRPVADALDYAHRQGVVHRDVKPGNVIVDPAGHVTLTDFGIARATHETQLTTTGTLVGTPEYASPEQAQGTAVSARSDLYNLAVTAYEMLSGCVPFEAESTLALLHKVVYDPLPSIRQANPDLPAGVGAVMRKALAKDPGDRYEEASVFVETLAQALAGELVEEMSEPEPPASVPATDPAPTSEREEPEAGQTEETPSETQPSAPAQRRVLVWTWVLGILVVLAVLVVLVMYSR